MPRALQNIYNHSWVLNLMRKDTEGTELVRPTITRLSTNLLPLQSLLSKIELENSCDEWNASQWSHKQDLKDTIKKTFENLFWKKVAKVVRIVEHFVKVLQLADGEKLTMDYIYEAMDQAKEQIRQHTRIE
jgi:hypothetical protein